MRTSDVQRDYVKRFRQGVFRVCFSVYPGGYYKNDFSRKHRRKRQKNDYPASKLNTDLKEKSIAAHISVQYDPSINILKTALSFGDLKGWDSFKNMIFIFI